MIGGRHTASGKPILANDPHLGLEAPILWYLARIVTPEAAVKGATVPGFPNVLLGQNDNVAWGFTTTLSDVQDLFIETVDPKDANRYLTPEGSAAFETRQEIIHVKGKPDVTLTVRATRHGPVLSDIDAESQTLAGTGKIVALAFTGLGASDTTPEAFAKLNRARGQSEILEALKLYQTPTQNIVYADREGHIGFINPGLLPIRKSGDGRMPCDGASGACDWAGVAAFEQAPRLRDPEAGFIFNANSAVVPPNFSPTLGREWGEPYRDVAHPGVHERGRHSHARHVGADAGRSPVIGGEGFAACAPGADTSDAASKGGAGPAPELGRGYGQRPRRASDFRRLAA